MFSKSCEYALRATLYLSSKSDPEQVIDVKHIAESLNIPQPYLAKILQKLSRNHLISSIKGPNGGFFLTQENLKTTVLEIVECIDGDLTLRTCIMGLPNCSSEKPCQLHTDVLAFRDGLKNALARKTIDSFSSQP